MLLSVTEELCVCVCVCLFQLQYGIFDRFAASLFAYLHHMQQPLYECVCWSLPWMGSTWQKKKIPIYLKLFVYEAETKALAPVGSLPRCL